jgi:hypothetical protein
MEHKQPNLKIPMKALRVEKKPSPDCTTKYEMLLTLKGLQRTQGCHSGAFRTWLMTP